MTAKDLVTRFYDEAINQRDPKAADRYLTDDFTHNDELRGRAGEAEALAGFIAGFSDLHVETITQIADGDTVAAVRRWTGTNDGTFAGCPPTGRRAEFTSTTILHLTGDRVRAVWDEVDLLGLFTQLGHLPELGAAEHGTPDR